MTVSEEDRKRFKREAIEFLRDEKVDPQRSFEVQWTFTVSWTVMASSRDAVKEIAEGMDGNELIDHLSGEIPNVSVSMDLEELVQRQNAEHPTGARVPSPDAGVFAGKIRGLDDYLGEMAWALLRTYVTTITCRECGHADELDKFRGEMGAGDNHIPVLKCRACGVDVDWRELVDDARGTDDKKTIPLFEEGEGE